MLTSATRAMNSELRTVMPPKNRVQQAVPGPNKERTTIRRMKVTTSPQGRPGHVTDVSLQTQKASGVAALFLTKSNGAKCISESCRLTRACTSDCLLYFRKVEQIIRAIRYGTGTHVFGRGPLDQSVFTRGPDSATRRAGRVCLFGLRP